MDESDLQRVEAVRRFNRFYTQQIGALREGLLESPFSLTEARVIYELARHERVTAAELGKELGLDAGYLSRILRGFRRQGLVEARPCESDGRRSLLALTGAGKEAFARLDAASRAEIGAMLERLPPLEQGRLVGAMQAIEEVLGGRPEPRVPYVLRSHQPGDIGWVVHRHGVVYAEEYGWDERFEALVAEVAAKFIQNLNPKRERCWIAERDGEIVGSVFLVEASPEVAQLRLLLVEPKARGLGIGSRLVDECIRFARRTGYRRMILWTQNTLYAARRIYHAAGFRLVREEVHNHFGPDLVAEIWEMEL